MYPQSPAETSPDERFIYRLTLAILHRAWLDHSPRRGGGPTRNHQEAGEFLQSDFARFARDVLEEVDIGGVSLVTTANTHAKLRRMLAVHKRKENNL